MTPDGLDILNQIEFFVAYLDLEGRIKWINQAAVNVGGFQAGSVRNLLFWEAPWFRSGRRSSSVMKKMFDAVIATRGGTSPEIVPVVIVGGITIDIEMHMAPYFSAQTGEMIGVLPHAQPVETSNNEELDGLQQDILTLFRQQKVHVDTLRNMIDAAPNPMALVAGDPLCMQIFNAAAAPILSDDAYSKPVLDWSGDYFHLDMTPLALVDTPLLVAMATRQPAELEFYAYFSIDPHTRRRLRVRALPTEFHGEPAACVYWEEIEAINEAPDDTE